MKKYYKCHLCQVNDEKGFVSYEKATKEKSFEVLEDLIVERCTNPFYVREIVTGLHIPVLYTEKIIKDETVVKSDNEKAVYIYKTLFNSLDTFVNIKTTYHEGKVLKDEKIGLELATDEEVENYQNRHNKDLFYSLLNNYFLRGHQRKSKFKDQEKSKKINEKEEKRLIRYVNRKSKKNK